MSKHLGFLRHNFYGNAQLVLQKCRLNAIAEKLCKQFNLGIAKDLCELTDEVIDKIPWLRGIQSEKLKHICAICRQIQLENNEAKEHSVYDRNGDLHALLELLQGTSSAGAAARRI